MIVVSRLNGEQFGVNAEHIERVEETPDTVLTLLDGTKYIVRESLDDVLERVIEYRAKILQISYAAMPGADGDDGRLRLVSTSRDKPHDQPDPEQGPR